MENHKISANQGRSGGNLWDVPFFRSHVTVWPLLPAAELSWRYL
ncbi:hypothetical protein CLOSTHATH_03646 [Hungatella hathewayi DSM 13479]|uniref:Uncharacterized protein n=1 Tax=Hungatella hathewayi DSM 13479 TaxID=566550 RepID=D3AJ56_9FIRM|nr:hypothetical protein CLOSTHATH_03646 [Hungatella hathewayi DSM 13479]